MGGGGVVEKERHTWCVWVGKGLIVGVERV